MSEEYRVRDFMTASPDNLQPDTSLMEAILTFRRTDFRHLPVVDGTQVVGIISENDVQRLAPSLLRKISQEEYNGILTKTTVGEVMTRDPLTVSPETKLLEAAIILSKRKIGCLPVVEGDGRLIGIITLIDMLVVLIRFLQSKAIMDS